ncbi:MAG: carboxymuconolactone decarboxylase family protein [Gemmatimonadales bacterium]
MARQKGASGDLVDAVQDRGSRRPLEELEAGWRAALAYADVVHRSGHEVADELHSRLRESWDDGQIIEIALVVGMTEYFNRFNDSLRVEPTR